MSDEGTFSLPTEAIAAHYLATKPLSSPRSAEFVVASLQYEVPSKEDNFSPSKVVPVRRSLASMYDPVESLKKKETLVAKAQVSSLISETPLNTSNLCSAVKTNKGLNFKTPTSYLSSVLKKAGAVDQSHPLFKDHANGIWKNYLSKNNFEDVSTSLNDGDFSFEKLKNGSLIVLEKSCFKEGTVAVYCDGKYYATKFVKTSSLVKKINSKSSSCQLGSGMRIVVEKSSPSTVNPETLASAY
jgi:hypothetical protein